ncbi:Sec-independent protein translocase subunit TatA [Nocardia nova]|jgi:sec-independent protein translocase protein TatA|uniref:Sec-independent protein translocase subunit TatA n=1 Tax=Nocardia sp. 852002-20019_SCH5090214 TaxID=1834087 RepID=UPI0009ED473F
MGSLSATHWLVIAGLFVVLFGAKRLPDAARSVGRSLRIFKSEVQEMQAGGAGTQTPSSDGAAASNAVFEPGGKLVHGHESSCGTDEFG